MVSCLSAGSPIFSGADSLPIAVQYDQAIYPHLAMYVYKATEREGDHLEAPIVIIAHVAIPPDISDIRTSRHNLPSNALRCLLFSCMYQCPPFRIYRQSLLRPFNRPFIVQASLSTGLARVDGSGTCCRLHTQQPTTKQLLTRTFSTTTLLQSKMPSGFYDPKPYKVQPTDTERLSDVVKVSDSSRLAVYS